MRNEDLTNGIRNHRSALLATLSTLGVFALMYPELSQLLGDEPIGDGVSTLIVGALVLVLIFGLTIVDWAENKRLLNYFQGKIAMLTMISVVIGGSSLVLYSIPNSPGAIGVLLVAVPAALLGLRDILSRTIWSG